MAAVRQILDHTAKSGKQVVRILDIGDGEFGRPFVMVLHADAYFFSHRILVQADYCPCL